MTDHDARAEERHELTMKRLEKKHEREKQFALDTERVIMEGSFRRQTREARQSAAKLEIVLEDQRVLREQIQQVETDRNCIMKELWRERRLHNVNKQTW